MPDSTAAPEARARRRFSSSSTHKLESKKQRPPLEYKRVPLNADISAYILRLYLRDSFLELPEHAAWVGTTLRASVLF